MENWLLKRARLSPDRPALYTPDTQLTFSALAAEVHTWAAKMASYPLKAQRFIGLLGPNTKATYSLILACQQLGYPVVLLNTRLSPEELQWQINDADPQLLLVADPAQTATLTLPDGQLVTYDALAQQKPSTYTPVAEFSLDTVTDMMYTSGSTGRPKGVLQTFGNHFYSAIGTGLNFGLTQEDVWICAVPLFHISGLSILMRSLVYGLAVCLEPKFQADTINTLLQQKATLISVVPYMLKQLLKHLPEKAHYQANFKGLFLGGGPIDAQTLRTCQARQIPVVQSYGMTETASNVVALNFADAPHKLGAAGQALFPVTLRIAKSGEIQLKSPTLAVGYHHQAQKYAAKFTPDHWFKTGDVGYLDDAGFLYVQGRTDTMFISGGENIFPNEIEACYQSYPGIEAIVVTHRSNAKWGAVPVALIVTEPKASLIAKKLRDFGRQRLAHYKVPVTFYTVKSLPKTGNGKIDYAQINTLNLSQLTTLS